MKRAKRWLAGLLGAVLLISLLPAAALAEEELPEGDPAATELAEIPAEGEVTLAETDESALTRAELAELVYNRFFPGAAVPDGAPDFSDIAECPEEQRTAIRVLAANNIINGVGTDTFDPDGEAMRYAAVVVIWHALGSPGTGTTENPFTDVDSITGNEAADEMIVTAITALIEQGILAEEAKEEVFEPTKPATAKHVEAWLSRVPDAGDEPVDPAGSLTRAQLAAMIYEDAQLKAIIDASAEGREPAEFADVTETTEGYDAIMALAQARVLSGVSSGAFEPNGAATRVQAAVVLWRAAGCLSNDKPVEVPYTDIIDFSWAAAALNCLYALGILENDEQFRPNDMVTADEFSAWLAAYHRITDIGSITTSGGTSRAEMAVIFYRAYQDALPDPYTYETSSFPDISDCTEEQQAVITLFNNLEYAEDAPIIAGYASDRCFHPHDPVTKQQTAAILYRIIAYIEREAGSGAAVSLASLDEAVLLDVPGWFGDTLTFLTARGLSETSLNAISSNPDAPGVERELQTWSAETKPAAPTFSPAAGMYAGEQLEITITAASGMTIYYTTDGSEPTTASTRYTGPFTISELTTVKAIAVPEEGSGLETSPVVTAKYSLYTEGDGYVIEDGMAVVFNLNGLKNAQNDDSVYKIIIGDRTAIEVNEDILLTKELEVYGTLTIAGDAVLTVELVSDDPQMQYANYWENLEAFLHFVKDNGDGTTTRVRKLYGSRETALDNLTLEGYDLFLVALCGSDLTLDTDIAASTVLVLLTNADGSTGALTIPDGTAVKAREFGMPIEGSTLIVEAGGSLEISDPNSGGWVNGDVEFRDTQPPEGLAWNGSDYYPHLVALWYNEDEQGNVSVNTDGHDDGVWMTPLDEPEVAFAMMRYDATGGEWIYEVLSAEALDTAGLTYKQREDSTRMFLSGAEWNKSYDITHEENGITYSLRVDSYLPDIGYYSEPEVSEDTYINHWDFSPISDGNVFYLCVHPEAWFVTEDGYALSENLEYMGDEVPEGAISYEYVAPGVWKITVTGCAFYGEYRAAVLRDGEADGWVGSGIWIDPAERLVYSDGPLTDASSESWDAELTGGNKDRLHDTLTIAPYGSRDNVVLYLLRYEGYNEETGEAARWICEYTDGGSIWCDEGITVEQAENSAACTVNVRHAGTYHIGHLDGEWVDEDTYELREGTERGIPLTVSVTFFDSAAEVSTYEDFKAAVEDENVSSIKITADITIPAEAGDAASPLEANKPILVAAGATLSLAPGAVMTSNVPGPKFYYEDSDNMWTHVANGMAAYLLWYDAQTETVFRALYGSMPEDLTAVMNDKTHGDLYTAVFGRDVTLTEDISLPQLWVMNNSSLTIGKGVSLTMSDPEYNKLHVEAGDLTLEEGAALTVGGIAEYGSSLSMHDGNLTISKDAALEITSDMYLLRSENSGNGNLIVQEGGTLTLGETGGWVEGDVVFFGSDPDVPETLGWGGELYYTHLAACWSYDDDHYDDALVMTPYDWYPVTFELMSYDADKHAWIYSPIASEQLTFSDELVYGPDENDGENPDKNYLKANGTAWDQTYSVSYNGYSLPVYIRLPDVGYYSGPEAAADTFLERWDYSPLGENVFYLCVNPDAWFMQEHENWDLGLNIIYQDGRDSGIILEETGTRGVWKITAEAPAFGLDIEVLGTNEDFKDLVLTGRGIWIDPVERLLYSEELLTEEPGDVDYDAVKDRLRDTLPLTAHVSEDIALYLLVYDSENQKWVCEYTNSDWVRGDGVTVETAEDGMSCRVTADTAGTCSITRLHGEETDERDENGNVVYEPIADSTRGIPLTVEVKESSFPVAIDWETGTAALTNQSGNTVGAQLILAAYDANGRMCGVSTAQGTLAPNAVLKANVPSGENTETVKVFVLDSASRDPLYMVRELLTK